MNWRCIDHFSQSSSRKLKNLTLLEFEKIMQLAWLLLTEKNSGDSIDEMVPMGVVMFIKVCLEGGNIRGIYLVLRQLPA